MGFLNLRKVLRWGLGLGLLWGAVALAQVHFAGTLVSGDCVQIASSSTISDTGAPCNSGISAIGYTQLCVVSFSNATTINVDSTTGCTISSSHQFYELRFGAIVCGNMSGILLQVSEIGFGYETSAGGYASTAIVNSVLSSSSPTVSNSNYGGLAGIEILPGGGMGGTGFSGRLMLNGFNTPSGVLSAPWSVQGEIVSSFAGNTNMYDARIAGIFQDQQSHDVALNGVRLVPASSSCTGSVTLYGLK